MYGIFTIMKCFVAFLRNNCIKMKREDVPMKKARLILCIALASCMLYGCNKKDGTTDSAQAADSQEVSQEESSADTSATISDEEVAPAGKVKSTLSGEWMDSNLEKQRPIAIMFNNVQAAIPQTGISQADVIYEANVEGKLTRLMGIIKDWHDLKKVGSTRSCRDYYVYWALEWDAIYCHFGGPAAYVKPVLERPDVDNLDGTLLDGFVYFRTKDRKAPHNAYASGAGILKGIEKFGFSQEYTSNYTGEHFQFAKTNEKVELTDGVSATHIEPGYAVNKPWFDYNESDGLYYRFQYGAKHIDDAKGTQLAYTNIILQNTYYETRDAKGYLAFKCVDDSRTGWYITGGKVIPIKWRKKSDFEATKYYDMSGKEITLNRGKTWICIIEDQNKDSVVIK